MVKSENAELIVNGKRVENDLTFTATDSKMEVQIAFTFNASELAGKDLIAGGTGGGKTYFILTIIMNVVRTTVYRHRTSTLEDLRKMMEEE